MDHAEYEVDILSEQGDVIGTKKRKDVDKLHEILDTVHVVIITPDKRLALSVIPERTDLKNIYAGKFSTTAVTIRRHGESLDEAVQRLLQMELSIEDGKTIALGRSFHVLPSGVRRFISVHVLTYSNPISFSKKDIMKLEYHTRTEMEQTLQHRERFAETFLAIWEMYQDTFPF